MQALDMQMGYAVLWGDEVYGMMPWPLVWNQVSIPTTNWPFTDNIVLGFVIGHPRAAEWSNPSSSVISALPESDGNLPFSVVNYTLKAICPTHRSHVLLPKNAPVVSVAMCGHTMTWFEPDKAIFEKKCKQLKEYYELEIPNVEVKP
jgi:hypothetical protein